MPPLVWVELAPLTFWLDPAAVVDALLVGYWSSSSGILPKAACSRPSAIAIKILVGGWFWVVVG
jgi:hypothetical protein